MSVADRSTAAADQSGSARSTDSAVPITVAHGDGIGPEIMSAVLFLLDKAGARLELEEIEVGGKVYARGVTSGIESESWESLRRTGILLKAPITTPRGSGYKSLNVTIRKTLGLFANVRPCPTYHPFVPTTHPGMDLVVVRENEEDTYARDRAPADPRGHAVPEADHASRVVSALSATRSSTPVATAVVA